MMRIEVKNGLVDFIEAYHTKNGDFPARSRIVAAISIVTDDEVTPAEIDDFFDSQDTLRSLDERGITPPWILEKNAVGLTREQMTVVATLNNPNDRRSDEKKLRDLHISPRKYGGWMHNNRFSNYARESANNILAHSEQEAHKSLLHAMRTGNVNATKLYFEMTGRWNPANENAVNVQSVMQQVIEIIQRRVTDQETLLAIATDFQMLSAEVNLKNGGNQMQVIENEPTDPLQLESGTSSKEFKKPKGSLYF